MGSSGGTRTEASCTTCWGWGIGKLGFVVGTGSVQDSRASSTTVFVFLNNDCPMNARLLLMLWCSDEEDTRASLPSSEPTGLATDGAAVLRRVEMGRLGASWLEGPVSGDKVKDAVVLDILPVVRCAAGVC